MKTFAFVDGGFVREIIQPCAYDAEAPDWQEGDPSRIGQEIPVSLRFVPEMVRNMVDITDVEPQPEYGWVYEGGSFLAATPRQPSPEEVLLMNVSLRDGCLAQATLAITPLQYADDLGEATDAEKAQLLAWKRYMVEVNRVDLTITAPAWPEKP